MMGLMELVMRRPGWEPGPQSDEGYALFTKERRVVASYPENSKDILVSGYLKGGELLERRAAVVEVKVHAFQHFVVAKGFVQVTDVDVRFFLLWFDNMPHTTGRC